ncbi:MAG: LamG domain-containing protein, partial [Planctomycetes bacterium]|nr:LamG domain-containing protein [Planctomycetota bacterium]
MRSVSILATVLLLATAHAAEPGPARTPRPAELDPLLHCATFHLSFDAASFTPDLAVGSAEARPAGTPTFEPGVAGLAAVIGKSGAAAVFSRAGNFPITRRGAVSMWVCPQEWDHREDGNVEFLMTTNASFYLQRQGPLYGPDGQARRLEALQLLCLSPTTGNANVTHACADWKNGQWRLLVANWDWPVLEFSVDGGPFQASAVVHLPTDETFGDLVIGSQHSPRTLLDEVTVYRRPVTEAEARLLWQNPRVQRPVPRATDVEQDREAVSLRFKVYPSLNRIKARADIGGLAARDRVTGGVLRVMRAGEPRPLAEQKLVFEKYAAEHVFDVPLAIAGDYKLTLLLEGGAGVPVEPIVESFERRVFPWENNRLGISDRVIPPFT